MIKKNVDRIIFCILLILLFLTAAKSHGRQYRLERELAGYWTVSFTSDNAPWVERLWFRQRVVYWSLASLIALSMIIWRFKRKPNVNWKQWMLFALFSVITSMIASFIITGFVSMIRLFWKLAHNAAAPSANWVTNAVWGSLALWLATASLLFLFLALRNIIRRAGDPGKILP